MVLMRHDLPAVDLGTWPMQTRTHAVIYADGRDRH